MDDTPNLALPYIIAAQAQKHVTHNEAIRMLDALVQLSVADRDLTAPPGAPADGERHIVASGASGAWVGHDLEIAAYQDGAWTFHAPQVGWRAWIADEVALVAWSGTAWLTAGGGSTNPAALVGVNTTADATNRLAVKSDAVLFSHDDVTPGTGDQRAVINKSAAANTASYLFQTGFSGRAEIGLTGNDDFHVKVSANGSSWSEAFVIDKSNGATVIGNDANLAVRVGTGTITPKLSVHGTTTGTATFVNAIFRAASSGPTNVLAKSRHATPGQHGAVLDGDYMGQIAFIGSDGTQFNEGARIEGLVDGTPASGFTPGCLIFRTTSSGATPAQRMRINAAGDVRVGSGSPTAGVRLDIDGPLKVGSYTVAVATALGAAAGQLIFVSDETGGATLAFSDGTNWRRVQDRAIIT